MIEQLTTYFRAEKSESLVFMLAGLVAAAFAVYACFVLKQRLYTGIAVPLLLIGIVQFAVGASVYFRTDKQVARLEQEFRSAPATMAAAETPRMKKVLKSFTVLKYIETILIAAGLFLLFVHANDFWLGLGIGLVAQGTLSILLDVFAEHRAEIYLRFLESVPG